MSSDIFLLPQSVRTLFVSDLHLGAKHSQSGPFLDFLNTVTPEQLYLVGDFLDGWKLRRKWRWSAECSRIFERLGELLKRGTRVYYTPGNHDDFLRKDPFVQGFGGHFGKVQLCDEFVHETVDQKRYLVLHGDKFDCVESSAQWLSVFSSHAYDLLLSTNRLCNRLRRNRFRSPYQLCGVVKEQVKSWVRFFSSFESKLLDYTRSQNCEGVLCGHLHVPGIKPLEEITYCNTGDWVEHCTAIVETHAGEMEVIDYYSQNPGMRPSKPHPLPHLTPLLDKVRYLEPAAMTAQNPAMV